MSTLKHYDPYSRHIYTDQRRLYSVNDLQYPSVSAILNTSRTTKQKEWQRNANPTQAMERGSLFHAVVEHHFRGSNDPVLNELASVQRAKVLLFWESVQEVFPRISDIQLIESAVWHEVGHYAGTVDMLASFDKIPVILDWKTTDKVSKQMNCTRYRLQLSAYAGAINRMYKTKIRHGVIVLVSPTEAQVLKISLNDYWSPWLVRVIGYWQQQGTQQSEQVLEMIRAEYDFIEF